VDADSAFSGSGPGTSAGVEAREITCLNEPILRGLRHDFCMRHRWSFTLVLLLAVGSLGMMSPTGAAAVARPGVATGRAAPCAGPMAELVAHLSVYRAGVLVDRMSVPAGSTFRFRLAPGIYIISNQGHPGRFMGSKPFRVRSRRITRVVVRNLCM
jgi:hypothetical protein